MFALKKQAQLAGALFGLALAGFTFNANALPPSLDTLPQNAAPVTDAAGDPPARVGRISLMAGTVSFHTVDQDAWSAAVANYPVVSGDAFWTEPGSRAEIQVGNDALRLDASTEVEINELDDQGFRVEVPQGAVNIHVGDITSGEVYQIITPHQTVNVLRPGTYRVNSGVNGAPDEVSVLKGQAQVGDANGVLTIAAGETAIVTPGAPPSIQMQEATATPFDNWSLSRDNFEEPRQVTQYVSPYTTGYEDLNDYGTWQTVPDYGAVWIPTGVPVGWEPYRFGHWVWVSPWGWTWVDNAPWGFAPFHYGRWAYIGNHWGWVPGAIAQRPVYAPALVAFVGGAGWSVSVGERPVGWFALAPNEIYRPGYHVSRDYIRNVNIYNVRDPSRISNIANNPNTMPAAAATPRGVFANQRFATVVPADHFTSHSLDRDALKISSAQLTTAPVNASSAPPEAIEPRTMRGARFENAEHSNAVVQPHLIATPTAPTVPLVPSPGPAITHTENPTAQHETLAHELFQRDQNVVAPQAAPGPPIRHQSLLAERQAATPTTSAPVLTQAPVQSVEHEPRGLPTGEQALVQPQAHVETHVQEGPREIQVQHPVQTRQLTPSHQGWVRGAAVQQPQQHTTPVQQSAPHSGGEEHGPAR